eukprot:NODE_974_length_1643_cov_8.698243_g803_i0.p1 GENE.NODE_974_length_1643_cov_8.698243_g803_i0~~NODE_974_length_1643_cov_8.698243_g803_i0.p1  ORF type:complete len:531 (-),score=128.22 NODE_974_length_1643_cov_8.698243_g803_i0:50-1426(-)
MRILNLEPLGLTPQAWSSERLCDLYGTVRDIAIIPGTNRRLVAEADHRLWPIAERMDRRLEFAAALELNPAKLVDEKEWGTLKAPEGVWASRVRILDEAASSVFVAEMRSGLAALACSSLNFLGESSSFAVVGVAADLVPPKSTSGCWIQTYALHSGNEEEGDLPSMQLLHETPVDKDLPTAFHGFQGRLIAGVGSTLRLYELGKQKLLRKCEKKGFPNSIASIQSYQDRLFVADRHEGVFFAYWRKAENSFIILAECKTNFFITSMIPLDPRTVLAGDKFGSVQVFRCPGDVNPDTVVDPTAEAGATGRWLWDQAAASDFTVGGHRRTSDIIASFYLGDDIITGLHRVTLPGDPTGVVIYSTLMGAVGVLIPLKSKDDAEFLSLLEMKIREEKTPLSGRDQLMFRSYYAPVKNMIDGDYIHQFQECSPDAQRTIAEQLDKTPQDILHRLTSLFPSFF